MLGGGVVMACGADGDGGADGGESEGDAEGGGDGECRVVVGVEAVGGDGR